MRMSHSPPTTTFSSQSAGVHTFCPGRGDIPAYRLNSATSATSEQNDRTRGTNQDLKEIASASKRFHFMHRDVSVRKRTTSDQTGSGQVPCRDCPIPISPRGYPKFERFRVRKLNCVFGTERIWRMNYICSEARRSVGDHRGCGQSRLDFRGSKRLSANGRNPFSFRNIVRFKVIKQMKACMTHRDGSGKQTTHVCWPLGFASSDDYVLSPFIFLKFGSPLMKSVRHWVDRCMGRPGVHILVPVKQG